MRKAIYYYKLFIMWINNAEQNKEIMSRVTVLNKNKST